nr:immunoglobulin light chain junction region [Macaca mulatta]
CLQSKDSPWAF